MNERIRQLAVEAKLIAPEYNGFDHTRLSISQQKFAELIVWECMKLNCRELSITAIERLLSLYEEHFEVEEC